MLFFNFEGKMADSNCAHVNHCCDVNLLCRKYFCVRSEFRQVVHLLGCIIYVGSMKYLKNKVSGDVLSSAIRFPYNSVTVGRILFKFGRCMQ